MEIPFPARFRMAHVRPYFSRPAVRPANSICVKPDRCENQLRIIRTSLT